MGKRCGCAADCGCVIVATGNSAVSGSGTPDDPYVVTSTGLTQDDLDAEFDNAVRVDQPQVFTAAEQVQAQQNLGLRLARRTTAVSTTAALTLDASLSNTQIVNLSASPASLTISNGYDGQRLRLVLVHTVASTGITAWPSTIRFAGSVSPTLTTTAGRRDGFLFEFDSLNWWEVSRSLNMT